ncbi:MAG TPA: type II toxin-antitoxin system VapC family toxin [Thermoanaerobaculia bacterium]|nr:type II toxin-antitoxin system VapC family toxin [Thermoanaerobaculia bacterium]
MQLNVYLESSFVSYLAAWPSRDLLTASNQERTHTWWRRERPKYECCVSELVLREITAGDTEAATRRLALVQDLPLLKTDEEVDTLTEVLLRERIVPGSAIRDAGHIALAAFHGIHFLLTWNCRHIANATIRRSLEAALSARGYRCPIICTPTELMEEEEI